MFIVLHGAKTFKWLRIKNSTLNVIVRENPGRSKRSRSAFDLHLFTIQKPPEMIINGDIFRSWWVFLTLR